MCISSDPIDRCKHIRLKEKLTSNGREPGVIPTFDNIILDKILQLSLTQNSVNEVDPAEIKDLNIGETKSLKEPLVLFVTGPVLVGSESVGDAVEMVDDRTSEVVHGISLVLGTEHRRRWLTCVCGMKRGDLTYPVT